MERESGGKGRRIWRDVTKCDYYSEVIYQSDYLHVCLEDMDEGLTGNV